MTRLTLVDYCLGVLFVEVIRALKVNDKNFQLFGLVVVLKRLLETVMILDQMSRHRHNKRTFKMKSFSFFSLKYRSQRRIKKEFNRKLSFESEAHRKRERGGERERGVRIHTHTHTLVDIIACMCVCEGNNRNKQNRAREKKNRERRWSNATERVKKRKRKDVLSYFSSLQ